MICTLCAISIYLIANIPLLEQKMLQHDCKNLRIVSHLRKDCRSRLTELSKSTGIPISTVFLKLKELQNSYIDRFTCTLNYEQLGFNIIVNILFSVHVTSKTEFVKTLTGHPNVNSLYKINNGFDYIVEGVFCNMNQMEKFVENLKSKYNIRKTQVYYIIERIKHEDFMLDNFVSCDADCTKNDCPLNPHLR